MPSFEEHGYEMATLHMRSDLDLADRATAAIDKGDLQTARSLNAELRRRIQIRRAQQDKRDRQHSNHADGGISTTIEETLLAHENARRYNPGDSLQVSNGFGGGNYQDDTKRHRIFIEDVDTTQPPEQRGIGSRLAEQNRHQRTQDECAMLITKLRSQEGILQSDIAEVIAKAPGRDTNSLIQAVILKYPVNSIRALCRRLEYDTAMAVRKELGVMANIKNTHPDRDNTATRPPEQHGKGSRLEARGHLCPPGRLPGTERDDDQRPSNNPDYLSTDHIEDNFYENEQLHKSSKQSTPIPTKIPFETHTQNSQHEQQDEKKH